MGKIKDIELVIDENMDVAGVYAMSVVLDPAIEEHFTLLSNQKNIEVFLKEVDAEKRILMGPALIPNKKIYRRDEKLGEYNIHFSEQTVLRASELFLERNHQLDATKEHAIKVDGTAVVQSWIIDDPKMDKSKLYGFDLPKGTWMISMKVHNDQIWKDAKEGNVKGFSIEGAFVDKLLLSMQPDIITEIKNILIAEWKGTKL
jgi:hypothetical protein